ncbi:TPR repeat-containing protein [Pseudomonas sp. NFACC15-1]|uniref:tetratricopeptide repeat protein n=1 Tax=unclassified Pseudomonas TaxID=196821 RepID=UPI000884E617|nr:MULTISPECIES: tetratricopeptide repeat protein [unclassified Pseudomonas]SDA93531.1 TPR repeat-containing protein [Pseudomonas sp. NFACC15-1]SDW14169.1 TPR repeat-containing protein [Pseudomonas sp. NFACC14]
MLDASEYLHLAINASQNGDHHAALNYLNAALEIEPKHAAVHYFRAAEHAELGMLERAHAEMIEALELDPEMDIARFQLGLLSLQLSKLDEARNAFNSLLNTSQDMSLGEFSGAYLELLDERTSNAITRLIQGLTDCPNPALKADMERVLASLSDTVAHITPDPTEPAVFLGAYRNAFETP